MQLTATIEAFLSARYPSADVAVVGGSTARGERTPTSDVDLLLIGERLFMDERTSEASTHSFGGEIFEVFAYTPAAFAEWAQRDVDRHRPVILQMLVDGVALRDDGSMRALTSRWAPVLAAGPRLSSAESEFRRYVITDLLDDLRDAEDVLERQVIASALFERLAELMLLADGRWIGGGKWLPRRLRALGDERVDALATPLLARDLNLFADRVEGELLRVGGRMHAGFTR